MKGEGLGFGEKPKGALPFHIHNGVCETPVLDHMLEGVSYASSGGQVMIHFTVSKEHKELFGSLVNQYKGLFSDTKFNVECSTQEPQTKNNCGYKG